MKGLKILDRFMARIEETLLACGIMLMAGMLILNVLLRLFAGRSITFSEEAGQILLTVVTFVGLSYVARHGKHIRMNILLDLCGLRMRKIISSLIALVTSATLYWMTYVAFEYMSAIKFTGRVTPALGLPVYLVTMVVVYGFFSAATQYAHVFILNLTHQETFVGTYAGSEDEAF